MKLSLFEYKLPNENIANEPSSPRDHARLLVLDKNTGETTDKHFFDLTDILTSKDVLVFNQTKVFPARLYAGKIEILLLREVNESTWTAIHRGKVKISDILDFKGISATVISKKDYEIEIKFNENRHKILEFIEKNGKTPLPPYINSITSESKLRDDYQTVFARKSGSVAAPTAGLHFTEELIQKIKDKGIQIEYITLHVGAGTFLPIKETDITKHKMHSEQFEIDTETCKRLNNAKQMGKRIISVGTTTTRVLESISNDKGILDESNLAGETNIFIYPPYKFKFVDTLITNFHLPHSTLLALVSAFVSEPNNNNKFINFSESVIGKAYLEAIEKDYKFYSFGDGMIIL